MGGDKPLLPSESYAAYITRQNQKRQLSCDLLLLRTKWQKQKTSTPLGGKLVKMRGSVGMDIVNVGRENRGFIIR